MQIHKIGMPEPGPSGEPEVRRSERQKHLTENMFELKKDELINKERSFFVNLPAL